MAYVYTEVPNALCNISSYYKIRTSDCGVSSYVIIIRVTKI